jgi:hypothetical protein
MRGGLTKGRIYLGVALLVSIVGTAASVVSAWRAWQLIVRDYALATESAPHPTPSAASDAPTSARPHPEPAGSTLPVPLPTDPTTPPNDSHARRQLACGAWLSATSGKHYKFKCPRPDTLEIYEVVRQQEVRNGSGKIAADGGVEADLLVLELKRTAHLKLTPSADGDKLEGSWRGDDPREAGLLTFYRSK